MNLRCICACTLRVYAVWLLARVVGLFPMIASVPSDFPLQYRLPSLVDFALSALISGATWIYASDLAEWAIGKSRSAAETGIKMASLVVLVSFSGSVAQNAVYWFPHLGAEPEQVRSLMYFQWSLTYTIAFVSIISLSVLLLFLARPIGAFVARAERVREIRREIE